MNEKMTITSLEAENFKCLKLVRIDPETQKPIVLTGGNAQGKSTTLDAIVCALTGKAPADPIRHGETKARIKLELGELIIERTFGKGAPRVSVKSVDGLKYSTPQKLLNGIYDELTIDPFAFANMKPKEQRELLLKAAGVDLTDWESRYKAAYDERTHVNRNHKEFESYFNALERPEAGCPTEEISISGVSAELDKARRHFNESQQNHLDGVKKRSDLTAEIQQIENEISDLTVRLEALKVSKENLTTELNALVVVPPAGDSLVRELEGKLEHAEQLNEQARLFIQHDAAKQRCVEAHEKAQEAQEVVDNLLAEKQKMIQEADFGVEGISVDDEGVLYGDDRIEQLSTAQQIGVSSVIAMAQNPKLNIIMIREGALIGKEIWEVITTVAAEEGYQVWCENFQEEPGEVGLHFEDGEIVAIDGKEVGK